MASISKVTIIVISFFILSACGHESVWQNAGRLVKSEFNKSDNEIPHTREEINNIPFASIAVQFEDAVPSLMILGYVNANEKLQWVSSNDVSVTTRYGRIVHTVGFETDISHINVVGGDFLGSSNGAVSFPLTYDIIMETRGLKYTNELLKCTAEQVGGDVITILDVSYETTVYKEKCESSKGWKAENFYWKGNEKGVVWKSQQSIVNGEHQLELNILKYFR